MEKPKRPLSAYMIWLNSARGAIKLENPDYKVTDVAKKGGELWRNMKDKTEWEAKAAQAKRDYEVEVKEFEKNGGDRGGAGGKKRKAGGKKPAKKSKKNDSEEGSEEESE